MKKIGKMTSNDLGEVFEKFPREELVFAPTPFHKAKNLSKDYGVDIYMKREDMSGPSVLGGNKTRKLELILGAALEKKVDYLITYGSYQTNSAMEMATFCNICGIKPIIFMGDTKGQGDPTEFTGNLLVSKMLDAEIHYVRKPEPQDSLDLNPLWLKVIAEADERKKELEKEGYKVDFVPVGSTHQDGWISFVNVFKELMEQTGALGFDMDYIFHTNGSGGSLPGMIAAKLMTGSKVKIISINVRSWEEGNLITKKTCLDRVKYIFDQFNLPCPSDEKIYAEMNIDENFMAPGYGIPSVEGTDAIRQMIRREGLLIDPTYSGKGFAGLLDYVKKGIVPAGSKVVFIHTGGTGGLFADTKITKGLFDL